LITENDGPEKKKSLVVVDTAFVESFA